MGAAFAGEGVPAEANAVGESYGNTVRGKAATKEELNVIPPVTMAAPGCE